MLSSIFQFSLHFDFFFTAFGAPSTKASKLTIGGYVVEIFYFFFQCIIQQFF